MNALLVGSGGREHALAWKLRSSPHLGKLLALPGSEAISELAEIVTGNPLDFERVIGLCRKNRVSLAVVGPEAPLAAGLADALSAANIPVFGPRQAAARLESSKSFAKDFLQRHKIPTARYEAFSSAAEAQEALDAFGVPVVVKADGLAAGKGVRVCRTREEALLAIDDFMVRKTLGDSGGVVVLEECLSGPEATLLGFCDGQTFLALPASSDHKRLKDGDLGPNTGGMGVLAPTPWVTPELSARIKAEIIDRTMDGLIRDRLPYCGMLYIGLMLTPQGPKVLEYNARFGDPETQALLPLLRDDLVELMQATVNGTLSQRTLHCEGASVTVVLASEGYPDRPVTGRQIRGLDSGFGPDILLFHAGTKKEGAVWKTAGGRVLGVTAKAATLAQARERAYAAAERISFEGAQYRKDIADFGDTVLDSSREAA